jgi:hypothetical protein
MAVTTANTLKLSDVCNEIYGSTNTSGKSLAGCHAAASGTFMGEYATAGGDTLLDFRGYTHVASDTTAPVFDLSFDIDALSSSSLGATWQSSDNTGVTSQTVYWRPTSGGSWSSASVSASAQAYTISGLNSSTSYDAYCVACDAAGNCTTSNTSTASTTEFQDTSPPTFPNDEFAIDHGATTSSSIKMDWAAASDNVGVTSYKVYRSAAGGGGNYTVIATLGNNVLTYTNTGLSSGTTYNYFIEATDAAGNSGPLSTTEIRGTTTSSPATLSISPTSVYKGQEGGSFVLTITTTASWTLTDNATWLSASATSGTGNTSININYAPNSGNFRSGSVSVSITGSTKYCYVDQEGGGGGFEEPL